MEELLSSVSLKKLPNPLFEDRLVLKVEEGVVEINAVQCAEKRCIIRAIV
jgi:hypothetical protein